MQKALSSPGLLDSLDQLGVVPLWRWRGPPDLSLRVGVTLSLYPDAEISCGAALSSAVY